MVAVSIVALTASYQDILSDYNILPSLSLYSYDWVHNFGIKSPDTITRQGRDELLLGERLMRSVKLVNFEQGRHLTMA